MSVYIHAYERLIKVADYVRVHERILDWREHTEFRPDHNLPHLAAPLDHGVYRIEGRATGLNIGGCWAWFNWQTSLCKALTGKSIDVVRLRAELDMDGDTPLLEQFVSGICEGAVGPVVAAKLARDYDRLRKDDPEIYRRWGLKTWHWAFRLAGRGGAVLWG